VRAPRAPPQLGLRAGAHETLQHAVRIAAANRRRGRRRARQRVANNARVVTTYGAAALRCQVGTPRCDGDNALAVVVRWLHVACLSVRFRWWWHEASTGGSELRSCCAAKLRLPSSRSGAEAAWLPLTPRALGRRALHWDALAALCGLRRGGGLANTRAACACAVRRAPFTAGAALRVAARCRAASFSRGVQRRRALGSRGWCCVAGCIPLAAANGVRSAAAQQPCGAEPLALRVVAVAARPAYCACCRAASLRCQSRARGAAVAARSKRSPATMSVASICFRGVGGQGAPPRCVSVAFVVLPL